MSKAHTFSDSELIAATNGSSMYKLSKEFPGSQDLFLLVEDEVFCVNRKNLVDDSEFFKELFELPPEKGKVVEGSDISHPLRIEGIRKDDFVLFLRAVFPAYASHYFEITCEQWTDVLKLLTMWRFTQSRDAVLKNLKAMADPALKISLYSQYGLDEKEWLIAPASILAKQLQSLSEEDGRKLGLSNTIKIAAVREEYQCNQRHTMCPFTTCAGRSVFNFDYAIRRIFGLQKGSKSMSEALHYAFMSF